MIFSDKLITLSVVLYASLASVNFDKRRIAKSRRGPCTMQSFRIARGTLLPKEAGSGFSEVIYIFEGLKK